MAARYNAALDMVQWADGLGCATVMLGEHHGSQDGYLPSPLLMAAAMAARTKTMRFSIEALLAPFYDPLRLAEDVAVLDNLSEGVWIWSLPEATSEMSSTCSAFE